MKMIPGEDRTSTVTLNDTELLIENTLGVIWHTEDDVFKFEIRAPRTEIKTRRAFLKYVASIFDPMGLICPIILRAKVLMQEMWTANYEWDEQFNFNIQQKVDI